MLLSTAFQLILLRQMMLNTTIVGDTPLSAYIIPLNDAHQGTRVPACSARLSYISGFTGSSGTAVVLANVPPTSSEKALLWTDGRYFTQATAELDENWTLMRGGLPNTPSIKEYLAHELGTGAVIGVDPSLYSKTDWNSMEARLKEAGQRLLPVARNLIDSVWAEDPTTVRPPCPSAPLRQIPVQYTGKSTAEKLRDVRNLMTDRNVEGVVINQLDDIAWLLNLRGFDIPSAALFLSFVIVKKDRFELFIDQGKLSDTIRREIVIDGGSIYAYSEVNNRLTTLVTQTTGKIWLDKTCSYSLVSIVPEARQHIELSAVIPLKAVKNAREIEGVKNALIRDAAFLARFYAWVERSVLGGATVTELSASDYIQMLRNESSLFLATSFTTIAGVDSNGAIIHYRPTEETNKRVTPESMFLVDAGATYMDGTTDITRTFHYGTPSDFQRECYTRVLKGQIAVARAVFPMYSRGNRLDSFARKFLWDIGLDYGHGTGHGIGINVHEGPSRISYDYNLAPDDHGLRENMLTSNEPGYYDEGLFGIRVENIVRIVNSTVTGKNGRSFLAIEDLTFLPYQHKLIKKELLTKPEIEYLNDYQEKVRQVLGSYVKQHYPNDPAYDWIIKETPPF